MKTKTNIRDRREDYAYGFHSSIPGDEKEGWYFWDKEYPEEGSNGPYATKQECKEAIDVAAYEAGDSAERLYLLVKELGEAKHKDHKQFVRGRMFELTFNMELHPDWYDLDCNCASCRSYS